MALPQQVVEQLNLSGQSRRTPGWSSGIILFSGSIFLIVVCIYAGLQFGYEPYLNGQISALENQVQKVGQSISPSDEATLITFYSQVSNIQSLLKSHVFFSRFLTWLEQNTEANVYYTNMTYLSGDQITLNGNAKTSADIPEQIAVFEAAPNVSAVSLSNISYSSAANNWNFIVGLTMKQSIFLWTPSGSSPSIITVPVSIGTSTASPSSTPISSAPTVAPGVATTTIP